MTTQTPAREMYLRPTAFEVASESKPDVTYRVQLPDCGCADFRYRRTQPATRIEDMFCKHIRQALSVAGWQLPATAGLDEATVIELLTDLGAPRGHAANAVRRSRANVQGTLGLGDGVAVIVYRRSADVYDVQLPG